VKSCTIVHIKYSICSVLSFYTFYTLTNIFASGFLHQTTSPGRLIHRLNPFRIQLRIREENWQSWLHRDVTACHGHCCATNFVEYLCEWSEILLFVQKSDLAAQSTPLWHAQRYHWNRRDMQNGVNYTAVPIWHVGISIEKHTMFHTTVYGTLSQNRWMISLLIIKRKNIHPMEWKV
jgi:hypothetical protein